MKEKSAYLVVKINPNLVGHVRRMLHDSKLVEGDVPFYADARSFSVTSPNRDNALSKYDKLATVYETTMSYLKERRNASR